MAPKPPVSVFQARYAALTRDRAADDPELIAAHRDFVYARLQVHIADITADPSLTERQQQEKIA